MAGGMRPRWGVLGPGGIAAAFVADLQLSGGVVSAVGSRSAQRSRAFADAFGVPHAHGGYQELVNDPAVDVVYVASPHAFHADHALLAIEAGKHVLVEKPFALDHPSAKRVVEAAAQRGVLAMEGMWSRYLPHMTTVRTLLQDGAIGTVLTVVADHSQALPRNPEHRLNDPALGGGALLDLGVYPVTLAYDVLGPAKSVDAAGTLSDRGIDIVFGALIRHRDGGSSTVTGTSIADGTNAATIIGAQGSLQLDPVWYKPTPVHLRGQRGELIRTYESEVTGLGLQYEALEAERLIETGRTQSPLGTPQDILEVARIMDEIRHRLGVRYPTAP